MVWIGIHYARYCFCPLLSFALLVGQYPFSTDSKRITSMASRTDTLPSSHEKITASNVWIYTLVGTDYQGYRALPHFFEHYTLLGVPLENFIIDLLHDPAEDDHGLKVGSYRLSGRVCCS
jgi:hypothetical protein